MSNALYLVKPDAYVHRDEIKTIMGSVCDIKLSLDVLLDEELIAGLYPYDAKQQWFSEVVTYLSNGKSELNIVSTCNYNLFQSTIGLDRDPLNCSPDSIRFKFGKGKKSMNGFDIYKNAVHRTKNIEEFSKDYAVFQHLF